MYFITFVNYNKKLCSYTVEAENMTQAIEIAKILSAGTPVNVVEV